MDAKWQEVATKLDLAKAYEEMGDKDGARDLPGATRDRQLGVSNTYVYKLKPNAYTLQALDDWESAPDIDYVEPNFIYKVAATPTDPDFNLSWGVGAIHAPDVWGVSQGEGVTVAVVDTGVSASQPDLAGQVADVEGVVEFVERRVAPHRRDPADADEAASRVAGSSGSTRLAVGSRRPRAT